MAEYLYLIPLYRSSDFYQRTILGRLPKAVSLVGCASIGLPCAALLLFLNSKECPPIPASLNRSFHMDSIGNFHRNIAFLLIRFQQ